MIVRLFQPRFASLVEAGTKWQTVRPIPKRVPKRGELLSLRAWTGKPYRSKQSVLRLATVAWVYDITIDERGVCLYARDSGAGWAPGDNTFARADGFASWPDMLAWFKAEHGLPFKGIVIYWK